MPKTFEDYDKAISDAVDTAAQEMDEVVKRMGEVTTPLFEELEKSDMDKSLQTVLATRFLDRLKKLMES